MKKFVVCLMMFVLLCSMALPAYAKELDEVSDYTITEPYDYGLTYGTEEWFSLTPMERKKIFSIPDEVANEMTTEALIKSLIANPYLTDIDAYDDMDIAIQVTEHRLHLGLLSNREDFVRIMIDLEKEIKETNGIDDLNTVNVVADDLLNFYILSKIAKREVAKPLMLDDITGVVYTLSGKEVPCYVNLIWENHTEITPECARKEDESYLRNYDIVKLADISPSYNCHSYAWHYSSPLNKVWIQSDVANIYLSDDYCFRIGTPIVNSKVVYFTNGFNFMNHSGVVYSVDNGEVMVVSKWGTAGLYRHPLYSCPYAESADNILYYLYSKQ